MSLRIKGDLNKPLDKSWQKPLGIVLAILFSAVVGKFLWKKNIPCNNSNSTSTQINNSSPNVEKVNGNVNITYSLNDTREKDKKRHNDPRVNKTQEVRSIKQVSPRNNNISVQSNNQSGGQTGFIINNNEPN